MLTSENHQKTSLLLWSFWSFQNRLKKSLFIFSSRWDWMFCPRSVLLFLIGRSETDHFLVYPLRSLSYLQVAIILPMEEALPLTLWSAQEATLPPALIPSQLHRHIQSHHGGGSPNALLHRGLRHLRLAVGGLSRHRPVLCLLRRPPAYNAGGENKELFPIYVTIVLVLPSRSLCRVWDWHFGGFFFSRSFWWLTAPWAACLCPCPFWPLSSQLWQSSVLRPRCTPLALSTGSWAALTSWACSYQLMFSYQSSTDCGCPAPMRYT